MNIVDENNKKMQWKKEIEKDTTFLSRTTPDGYSLALHTRYNKGWLHTTWLWFQCLVSKGWWNTAVAHECFFSAWVLIISADTVLKNFLFEKNIYIYETKTFRKLRPNVPDQGTMIIKILQFVLQIWNYHTIDKPLIKGTTIWQIPALMNQAVHSGETYIIYYIAPHYIFFWQR